MRNDTIIEAAGLTITLTGETNTFASVNQEWDQKSSGDGFKAINTMSSFVNTHELLRIFDQVADTVTMDDIKAALDHCSKDPMAVVAVLKNKGLVRPEDNRNGWPFWRLTPEGGRRVHAAARA